MVQLNCKVKSAQVTHKFHVCRLRVSRVSLKCFMCVTCQFHTCKKVCVNQQFNYIAVSVYRSIANELTAKVVNKTTALG